MKRTAVEDALAGWGTRKKSKARVSPRNFESWRAWRGMKAAVEVRRAEGRAKQNKQWAKGGRLVERGPDMFMDSREERGARDRALEDNVQQAEYSGLSAYGACRLRDILSRRVDAFRRALRGDPPARVEPMRVHLKPQAQAVKARPRRYNPVKPGG